MNYSLSAQIDRFRRSPELTRALLATLFYGAAGGIFTSILNNYLSEVHNLSAEMRGWLEFPRELPGFLITLVISGLILVMRETKMAAIAMLFTMLGAYGFGHLCPNTVMLVIWTMIWSLGDHIIFTVEGVIGLKLSHNGSEGKRLGQFGAARNMGTIIGVAIIYLLAKQIGSRYDLFYTIAGCCAFIAGIFYFRLKTGKGDGRSRKMIFKKRYRLFYVISALFGIRKQIFLAFGGWVLVSIYGVEVSTIALLYFIAATLGVIARPLLGEVIDRLGERTVLAVDELFLLTICCCYAFAGEILPHPWDKYLLFCAYIGDSVLFALRVARTTYLKKIAETPEDITPTISMGITIDHSVAMSLPVLSGYIWEVLGYRWVFIFAAMIAVVGFFVCLRVKVPSTAKA